MFKKLSKVYTAVFGEDNKNSCGPSNEEYNRVGPLLNEVRALKFQTKKQAKVIEALLEYLGLEYDYKFTGLVDEDSYVIEKKKK